LTRARRWRCPESGNSHCSRTAPSRQTASTITDVILEPRGYQALNDGAGVSRSADLAVPRSTSSLPTMQLKKLKSILSAALRRRSARKAAAGQPNARIDGKTLGGVCHRIPRSPDSGRPVTPPELQTIKGPRGFREAKEGRLPLGKPDEQWTVGEVMRV